VRTYKRTAATDPMSGSEWDRGQARRVAAQELDEGRARECAGEEQRFSAADAATPGGRTDLMEEIAVSTRPTKLRRPVHLAV
jgi:hypothetical protein